MRLRTNIVMATALAVFMVASVALASHQFTDVSDDNVFHADIEWLKDNGITQGCNPPDNTLFCPDDNVTRGQMAAFLHRFSDNLLPAEGEAGEQGPQGEQGPPGPQGPQGEPAPEPVIEVDRASSADLSGGDNSGDRVEVASLNLGEGDWTITGRVNLFVPDPTGEFKNSQGCGIYADGTQVAGAFGSSKIWISTAQGKFVSTEIRPFLSAISTPKWQFEDVVVTGPIDVSMECFIDQSHSGAQPEDRDGMAAQYIELRAEQ